MGGINAFFVTFLVGSIALGLLTDPPTPWQQHVSRVMTVVVLALAVVASVAAAVVSFLAYLQ